MENSNPINSINDKTILSNGVRMPWLGFGVYKTEAGDEVIKAVGCALENGYRSIDTAAFYANEEGVGSAVRESGLSREEVFITTKVWNSEQGYESTLKAFDVSRKKLGMDYLDLYLIHWPVKGKYKDTWRALEKLYRDGDVRAIGVSNFQIHHLEDLLTDAEVLPVLNQVEFHPLLTQKTLRHYCDNNEIRLEAWSPLMRGSLDFPILNEIAKKYDKKTAQIVLRWDLQHGVVTIPKSITPGRIIENTDIFDFQLSAEEMKTIDSLNENCRLGPDPDTFTF